MPFSFVLTGGGTGGHVIPALAVGQVLRERGHSLLYVGTREGMEARLAPKAGFDLEFVNSAGLKRVGIRQQIQTLVGLPASVASASRLLRRFAPKAVFSMGGYVAGPVMLAAVMQRIPLIVMEPNAQPGFANRRIGRNVYRALLGFESARRWFPRDRSEVTGLPVRPEFFSLAPKAGGPFTVLATGGSRGARKLNQALRAAWPLLAQTGVRVVHQTGANDYAELAADFPAAGVTGEVTAFIQDMARAFSEADLVVGRAGAGGVNEIAAAGMPSILIPFPFAADDHQLKNAQALLAAGAARLIPDADLTAEKLFAEIEALRAAPETLSRMRQKVQQFAHPDAAGRAADVMEEAARRT